MKRLCTNGNSRRRGKGTYFPIWGGNKIYYYKSMNALVIKVCKMVSEFVICRILGYSVVDLIHSSVIRAVKTMSGWKMNFT